MKVTKERFSMQAGRSKHKGKENFREWNLESNYLFSYLKVTSTAENNLKINFKNFKFVT